MTRAVHRTTWLIAATASMLFAGCSDPSSTPAVPTAPPMLARVAAPQSGVAATLDTVARALAMGLRSEEARRTLLLAMRASPMVEHKLVLQEFIVTPRGRRVLSHAARESGHSAAELAEMVNRLPALDFYVPGRAQRRSWRGSANVMVNATLQPVRGDIPGYDVQGEGGLLTAEVVAQGVTLIALHPAEPKARRMDPQPPGDSDVIEDPNDGTMAVVYVDVLPNGTTRVTAPASMAELRATRRDGTLSTMPTDPCDDPYGIYCDGGGGGGGPVVSGSIRVTDFVTIYACDYYCQIPFNDELEIEFKTGVNGANEQKTEFYGVSSSAHLTPQTNWPGLKIREPAPTGQQVTIAVWEIDVGDDDKMLETTRWQSGFPTPLLGGGFPRCNVAGYLCTPTYEYREINTAFAWIP